MFSNRIENDSGTKTVYITKKILEKIKDMPKQYDQNFNNASNLLHFNVSTKYI
jgi:hypothetical protein